MRIVLLGPPGSGKGELSKRIAAAYQVPIITQASVVDALAAESSELGRLAKEARDSSRVSDELLLALLRIQLPRLNLEKGYVLVDMPKNAGQADVLDGLLNELLCPVDLVLNLQVDPDDLMERLVGHIQCDQCGTSYNTYVNPPMVDGVCDVCGARVSRRPDDYEETISNRLRIYENQMGPLLQYYQLSGKLTRVDAGCDADTLWGRVKPVIDATPVQEVVPAAAASEIPPVESAPPSGKPAAKPKKAGAKSAAAVGKATKKAAASTQASAKSRATKKAVSGAAAPARKKTAKAATKPAPGRVTAKKTAGKKTATKAMAGAKQTAKKVAVKGAAANKASTRKVVSKKAAASKAPAKKAPARPAVGKKPVSKKVATRPARPAAAQKAPSKKAAAKKPVLKKAAAKKAAKKATAGKVVNKALNKKAPATKKVTKKAAKKKVARRG